MKAVILAGGLGTRISEETLLKPKPMVEIGNRPILWHIMKIYSSFDINEFIICCGYRGYMIKEYFANYSLHNSDITFDMSNGDMQVHESKTEPWKVTLVDTGTNTMTGGRIKRIRHYLDNDDFCMTYGDGVADVDIRALLTQHQQNATLATMTAVRPPGRFGSLQIEDNKVSRFIEKPDGDGGWINGGFFVLSPKVMDYIEHDLTPWERAPMEGLVKDRQLSVYKHHGFWQPMDTLRERQQLDALWNDGEAPWKLWA